MPWFYVDDAFADSKPVMRLDARVRNAAIGLWVRCGAWSAKEETDGHVPVDVVRQFGGNKRLIEALSGPAELWEPLAFDENWRKTREILFKNWEKWQKTHAENAARRKREADKKSTWRASKKGRDYVPTSDDAGMSTGDNVVDSRGDSEIVSTGESLYPDPTPPLSSTYVSSNVTLVGGSGGKGVAHSAPPAAAKGIRLPDDWMPDPATIDRMRAQFPHVDLKAIHEEFTDYWRAVPGARGRKLDWDATWRNRVREVAGRHPPQSPNGNNGLATSDRRFLEVQALKTQPAGQISQFFNQPKGITDGP